MLQVVRPPQLFSGCSRLALPITRKWFLKITQKPYSDIEFTPKITGVSTIAHLFKASKQILDDFAQLQSTVDAEMRYGLKYAEEQEILFGDGTGVHLHGIVPQASAFNPAFTVEQQSGIDDLRLAMLQAQLARFPRLVMFFTSLTGRGSS